MASVVLEGLSKRFPGGVEGVRDLSLELSDGEFVTVVGPSGCGKTTTLRLIAGLERPTAGRIELDGRPVEHLPPWKRGVAMVFQQPALLPHLTVAQNLEFGLRSGEREAARQRLALLEGVLGWRSWKDRRPLELSGGQRQRVALGRALVRQPAVFLLDEPLAHVDPAGREDWKQELRKLRDAMPTTTLLVTHDHAEALALGERVAVMDAGRLQQVGTPDDVYRVPANRRVATLVGSPPMNFYAGRVADVGGMRMFAGQGWEVPVPVEFTAGARPAADARKSEARWWLGIRGEDLRAHGAEGSAQRPGEAWLAGPQAQVDWIESAGTRTWIHVVWDEKGERNEAVVHGDAEAHPRPGDIVSLEARASRLHWFDGETERRVNDAR